MGDTRLLESETRPRATVPRARRASPGRFGLNFVHVVHSNRLPNNEGATHAPRVSSGGGVYAECLCFCDAWWLEAFYVGENPMRA